MKSDWIVFERKFQGVPDAYIYVPSPHEPAFGHFGFLEKNDPLRPVQSHPAQTKNTDERTHQVKLGISF